MTGNHDLVGLIDDAEKALSGETQRTTKKRSYRPNLSVAGRSVYLALIPLALFIILDRFSSAEFSDVAIETQLINILHSAQNSIRTHISSDGKLPDMLPNAALAAIVSYSIDESRGRNGYILSATSNGITVTMDSLGNIASQTSEQ